MTIHWVEVLVEVSQVGDLSYEPSFIFCLYGARPDDQQVEGVLQAGLTPSFGLERQLEIASKPHGLHQELNVHGLPLESDLGHFSYTR